MEAAAPGTSNQGTMAFLWAALAGAAVSLVLGVYAREHHPAGQALFTLGFSGTINMKAWLATLALTLAVVQIVLALWMYGKLGQRGAPSWVGPTHEGAAPRPSFPYIHSASTTWTTASASASVASHAFMLMVPLKPSVNRACPAGWCSRA